MQCQLQSPDRQLPSAHCMLVGSAPGYALPSPAPASQDPRAAPWICDLLSPHQALLLLAPACSEPAQQRLLLRRRQSPRRSSPGNVHRHRAAEKGKQIAQTRRKKASSDCHRALAQRRQHFALQLAPAGWSFPTCLRCSALLHEPLRISAPQQQFVRGMRPLAPRALTAARARGLPNSPLAQLKLVPLRPRCH